VFPPKLLIVNDEPGALLGIQSILENAPQAARYRIFTAQSGEEALRAVLQHEFAVILMDVKMPIMDGFTTAEAIHAHPRSTAIPIIFISAHHDDELTRLKGYEYGAVDYLPTPIVPQVLIAKVMVFVELRRQRAELEVKSGQLARMNNELQERQHELEAQAQRIRAVVENVGDGIITLTEDGTIESFNAAASQMFGWAPEHIIGHSVRLLIPEHLRRKHERGMRRYLDGGEPRIVGRKDVEMQGLHKSGELLPMEMTVNRVDVGERTLFVAVLRDIRKRKEAETAMRMEKERLGVTLNAIGDAIGDAVTTTDPEGCIVSLNRAATVLTGWQNEEAVGKPFEEIFNAIERKKGKEDKADNLVQLALLTRSSVTALGSDIWIKRRDGRRTPIDMSAAPLRMDDGTLIGVVHVARDISHMRRMTAELKFRASHDPLTGLINRAEFERLLSQAVETANIEEKQHALLFLDLDHFKTVNDTCGHDAGDELLRKVTQAMQRVLRQADTLGRLGGDEFAVLLDGCGVEPAARIAEQIRRTVDEFRFTHRDKVFSVGVSIGIAVFGPGEAKLSEIVRNADAACYAAKHGGRNRVHVHEALPKRSAERNGERNGDRSTERGTDRSTSARHS
jgi:diguanylate cyclase (GGDEF)-like protein/PAS domain S-box-containing protein